MLFSYKKAFITLGILCFQLPATSYARSIYDGLLPQDREKIDQGKDILFPHAVVFSDLPRMIAYVLIPAPPESAAAVFFDYGLMKSYVKGFKDSQSSPESVGTVYDVKLNLFLNPQFDLTYLTRYEVGSHDFGLGYDFSWEGEPTSRWNVLSGWARFEAHQGQTLMAFLHAVEGGPSTNASQAKAYGAHLVQWITAFKLQVLSEMRNDRPRLEAQTSALKKALGQKLTEP